MNRLCHVCHVEAEYPLAWTGKRIIPAAGGYMFRRHLMAYQFALQFCRAKAVLDADVVKVTAVAFYRRQDLRLSASIFLKKQ